MRQQGRGWWLVGLAALLVAGSAEAVVRHRRHRAAPHVVQAAPPDEAVLALEKSLPQNQGLPPLPALIVSESGFLQRAKVQVLLGLGDQDPQWQLSQTMLQVLPKQFYNLVGDKKNPPLPPLPADDLLLQAPNPDKTYRGLRLTLLRSDGKGYQPLLIAQGKLRAPGGIVVANDPGRRLEYWLFGTARIRRDLLLASQVLPVVTFEQCRVLGNSVIETTPRQCLLPDQNLLLETSDPLTKGSLRVKDYDSCLRQGEALIYTYPRRCLASGGRVFTEPPRLDASDVSGDILAPGTSNPLNLPQPMGTALPTVGSGPGSPVGAVGPAAPTVSLSLPMPTLPHVSGTSWLPQPSHPVTLTVVKPVSGAMPEVRPGVPWPVWPGVSPTVATGSSPTAAGGTAALPVIPPAGGVHGMAPAKAISATLGK